MRTISPPASSDRDRKPTISAKQELYTLAIEPGGMCRFDVQPTNSRHQHNYYEVVIVTGGNGEYQMEETTYSLSRGDLFLSPPNRLHEIRSFQTRDLELFFVMFGAQPVPVASTVSDVDAAFAAYCQAGETWTTGADSILPYVSLITSASSDSLRSELSRLFTTEALHRLTRPESASTGKRRYPSDIQAALNVIESRASGPVSVANVASIVNVSERTLRRRFAQHVGHGVAEEVRQRRMRIAAHHLLMGYSVTEVASLVGIEDVSQFGRAFQAVMGVTPKRFQTTYMPGSFRRVTEFRTGTTQD